MTRYHSLRNMLRRAVGVSDGEHQIVLNRLILASVVQIYLLILMAGQHISPVLFSRVFGLAVIYLTGGLMIALAMLKDPRPSVPRRLLQMAWDLGCLSLGMAVGSLSILPLYPVYLWAILGYGFRFGLKYMIMGAVGGAVGFWAAVHRLEVWQHTGYLFGSLVLALLIVPIYSATLIRFISRMRKQAEEASRAKSLFLASVSHELRTPLNAILGMSGHLSVTSLSGEQQDMVRTISTAGGSLLQMIEGLLDFTRVESGHGSIRAGDFSLVGLVGEIRRITSVGTLRKDVAFSVFISSRTPPRLNGDARHLRDILRNLAGNAVKFTSLGYVLIRVDAAPATGGRLLLTIEVTDTGIGFDKSVERRIFEPFTQADDSVVDRFGGSGLGLTICSRLVTLLGGNIDVRSLPGEGSVFTVTLPMQPAEPQPFVPDEKPAPVLNDILLLSRDPEVCGPLRARLAETGITVTLVTTASELTILLLEADYPRFVLSDGTLEQERILCDASHRIWLGTPGDSESRGINAPVHAVTALQPDADEKAVSAFVALLHELHRSETFPLTDPQPQVARPSHSTQQTEQSPEMTGRRALHILVVDDNTVNQKVVCKTLSAEGFSWRTADNGEDALDCLDEEEFDLVLMDVNMPVMNGIEATKLYRFSEIAVSGQRLPIVALTADSTDESHERCRNAGMNAVLVKPLQAETLTKTILSLIPDARVRIRRGANAGAGWSRPDEGVIVPFPPQTLNRKTLQNLFDLGGEQFRAEVISDFLREAAAVLTQIEDATSRRDWSRVSEEAHALRSAASNVGADHLTALCGAMQTGSFISSPENATKQLQLIAQEMKQVQEAFRPYCDSR
ncbi:response regulator [Acetobacter sp. AN02]|uniref:ATP-binding protein n=1 Tax=Acetobacter sp. AN02 TaxID=2894186 RepID=UPI00243414CE|nr:ATP-binding protein [Acetobacter sp. AN02]MDG6095019.1 response regulator [Acetobacter sp. AN02]